MKQITEEQYNEIIKTESNIIKFIDNNTNLLLLEQTDWVTTTRLFWSWDYKEYFNEEKVSELLFWHEAWFIKQLLKELETRTMEDIVNTYQFNIWFNEWLKASAKALDDELAKQFNNKQVTEEINSELWAIELTKEENVSKN